MLEVVYVGCAREGNATLLPETVFDTFILSVKMCNECARLRLKVACSLSL